VPMTSNMDSNPLINGQYMFNLFYDASSDDGAIWAPTYVNTGPNSTYVAVFPSAMQPFNMSGAYFLGLSPQTTLTVAIRSYIEIFPSQIGNTLTSLASPSAPFDERARRLYAECMKTMPPGVMLCENGLGDWLSDVAGKIANFVSPIASVVGKVAGAIPHPMMQAISKGAAMVEGVSNRFTAPSSEEVRDDGVQAAIQRERRIARSEAVVADARNRVAARSKEATNKARVRTAMAKSKKKK
jgi:hypothetical protein